MTLDSLTRLIFIDGLSRRFPVPRWRLGWKSATVASYLGATAALGQPATFTDLGSIGCDGVTLNTTTPGSTVLWYKFVVPPTVSGVGSNSWLDIFTLQGPDTQSTDPRVALFDSSGNLVAADNDDGPALMSELSFGQTFPLHQNGPLGGVGMNGRDGPLAGGEYWLAMSLSSLQTGPVNWSATCTSATPGWLNVRINATHTPCVPPLGGVGAALPSVTTTRNPVLLRVTGFVGATPPSTFAQPESGVRVDATALGLGFLPLFDDGQHTDVGANDQIWARTVTIPDVTDRAYELPFTIIDDQGRRGNGTILLSVVPCGKWIPFGTGANDVVLDIDGTSASNVIVGGRFTQVGGVPANRVARWDGSVWNAMGGGFPAEPGTTPFFSDFAISPNGTIVLCGHTSGGALATGVVAEWNGTAWTHLFGTTDGRAYSVLFNQSGDLVATGTFSIAGGVSASRVAVRLGGAWQPLGEGLGGLSPYAESSLLTSTGRLIVGGSFTSAGGVTANNVAQWDGSQWSPLGRGLGEESNSVTVIRELANGAIVAGGRFSNVSQLFSSTPVNIARWNGISWNAIGPGLNTSAGVRDIVVLPNGDLLVGGYFTASGNTPLNSVARWNGKVWTQVGAGLDYVVHALHVLPDGTILAGGEFTSSGGVPMNRLAQWVGLEHIVLVSSPQSILVRPSGLASLQVGATGGTPATYVWRRNGQIVSNGATPHGSVVVGATTPVLTISPVRDGDAGSYTCEVSNACNRQTSSPATLTVACPADLDGAAAGVPDGAVTIDDLLFFLVAFEEGSASADLDDDGDPALGDPDGAITIDDLLYLLARFELGC